MEDSSFKNHRIPSSRSSQLRILSKEEEENLLKQDSRLVLPFTAQKLELDAQKHWDLFYKRNKTNFFKDRHWTTSEFNELVETTSDSLEGKSLLEIGCGVGNLLFPLLEEKTPLYIYACDFSKRAIDFVKENPLYDLSKVTAFVADVTSTNLNGIVGDSKIDIVTLVFVLSAINPDKLTESLKNILNCVKPGGIVLFRDYAVNDMAQIRFKPGHKIKENLYMRQDGTRTYFFTCETVREVFKSAGFQEVDCCYVHCKTINKKEGIDAPRTFVQAKFQKPKI